MFLIILTDFGMDTTLKLRKNACKNAYLGVIFIPEKYVFRVCFESPFTRMISNLKYKWPVAPGPFIKAHKQKRETMINLPFWSDLFLVYGWI